MLSFIGPGFPSPSEYGGHVLYYLNLGALESKRGNIKSYTRINQDRLGACSLPTSDPVNSLFLGFSRPVFILEHSWPTILQVRTKVPKN